MTLATLVHVDNMSSTLTQCQHYFDTFKQEPYYSSYVIISYEILKTFLHKILAIDTSWVSCRVTVVSWKSNLYFSFAIAVL